MTNEKCIVLTNIFNDQMKNVLWPSEYLSIDETLYPMRHQIRFRQYNPNNGPYYISSTEGYIHKLVEAMPILQYLNGQAVRESG